MLQPPLLPQKQKIKSSGSKLSITTIVSIGLLLLIGSFITFVMYETQNPAVSVSLVFHTFQISMLIAEHSNF